jgi:hypothetical protein
VVLVDRPVLVLILVVVLTPVPLAVLVVVLYATVKCPFWCLKFKPFWCRGKLWYIAGIRVLAKGTRENKDPVGGSGEGGYFVGLRGKW